MMLFLPLSANAAITSNVVETSPASIDNMWGYYTASNISWFAGNDRGKIPLLVAVDPAQTPWVMEGYVSGDVALDSVDRDRFFGTEEKGKYFRFSTKIMSVFSQDIDIVVNGDDGHTLYIDGVLVGQGLFDHGFKYTLSMVANIPVQIDLIDAENGGGWGIVIGEGTVGLEWVDRHGRTRAPVDIASALENINGIQMNPEGFVPPVPLLSCIGFDAPMDNGPVKVKKNRALPLKAQLFDEDDFVVDDQSIISAPVLSVSFSANGSDAEDVSDEALSVGQGEEGNLFVYDIDAQQWRLNMKTSNFTAPGAYSLSLTSGDDSEYLIDTACTGTFVIK